MLRLVNLGRVTSVSSGRLEVFLNNTWGTVCENGFDVFEADLACQEAGFLYSDHMGTVGEFG